eukprot:399288_1
MLLCYLKRSCYCRKSIAFIPIRYKTSNKSDYFNPLSNVLHQAQLDRTKQNNKNDGVDKTRKPILIPTGINQDIKKHINKATSGIQIKKIIQNNQYKIEHPAIYGKAMKKCDELRDWKSMHEIMKLLLKSAHVPQRTTFTIFINGMAHTDRPELCVKYFHLMIDKYSIYPDHILLAAFIKSFRMQANYHQAEKYWKLCTEQYNVNPSQMGYTEIISVYSRAHQHEKAADKFTEYLEKVNNGKLLCNRATFNAYLNVLSRCGDIDAMENFIPTMKQYGLDIDHIATADIMRGYYAARNYQKCIHTLENWLNQGKRPNMAMMHLKCVALSYMIREYNLERKRILYEELQDTIYCQMQAHGLNANPHIFTTLLQAAIFMYYDNDPIRIVETFEGLVNKGQLGYVNYSNVTKTTSIDLHTYNFWNAQFILRYLIGYKLDTLLTKNCDRLHVIVGKGKHREGKANKQGRLRDFITKELSTWKPPINCSPHDADNGLLAIDITQLMPYLQSNNYAKEKLTVASNDWFYCDPRNM